MDQTQPLFVYFRPLHNAMTDDFGIQTEATGWKTNSLSFDTLIFKQLLFITYLMLKGLKILSGMLL